MASGIGPGLALSEHGPCLAGLTVTLDDVPFTNKLVIQSLIDAWCSSIQVSPKPSSDVTCWIVYVW